MHEIQRSIVLAPMLAAVAIGLVACRPDGARQTLPGKDLYAACVSCHGNAGQGNASIQTPPIAGLPAWYVEAQLKKFQTGLRGAHPDDYEGLRMRPMSRQMQTDGEVRAVAAYVSTLAAAKPAPSIPGGDAAAGAAAYGMCSACHGANGAGNEQMKAPPLAGQADWYLLAQLKKFKGGIRGVASGDVTGGQMRPMALGLADEQAMKNVVAHISKMSR